MKCEGICTNATYSVNTGALLRGPANSTNRGAQGPYSASQTPSAEVVCLWFIERTGLWARLGLGTCLALALLGDGQLLGLGVLLAPGLAHHVAHQHLAHHAIWDDAKSPA
jgi:hypothetical protein